MAHHVMVVGCRGNEAYEIRKPLLGHGHKEEGGEPGLSYRGGRGRGSGSVSFGRTCFNATNALSGWLLRHKCPLLHLFKNEIFFSFLFSSLFM